MENYSKYYEIVDSFKQIIKRFKSEEHVYTMQFRNLDNMEEDIDTTITRTFDHAIKTVLDLAEAGPADLVGLEFRHNSLQTPLIFPF